MRFPLKTVMLLAVAGAGAAGYQPALNYWKERQRIHYQEEEVTRGRILFEVNSTGTVQPVLSVHIGSFVSGPIAEIKVDLRQPLSDAERKRMT